MADLSQVLEVIAQNVSSAVYPDGVLNPSVCGVDVNVQQGWPIRSELDKFLLAGKAVVSVYPTNKERVVTKFERNYQTVSINEPTIALTVSGKTVTVIGVVETGQVVMIIVNGVGFAYSIQEDDTLNEIASNAAALIPSASAALNVITIPSAFSIVTKISRIGTAAKEIARVDRVFMISCWSNTHSIRASLGSAIDVYMKLNYKIVMPDGFYAQVFYDSTQYSDYLEKSRIYREDLNYKIQYATTVTEEFQEIADSYVGPISLEQELI